MIAAMQIKKMKCMKCSLVLQTLSPLNLQVAEQEVRSAGATECTDGCKDTTCCSDSTGV